VLPVASQTPTAQLIGGGFLGAVGAVALGQVAYQVAGGGRLCGDDDCGLWYGVLATVALEPVLIPVGVHIANHGQGSGGLTFLASAAAGAAGLFLGHAANLDNGFVYLLPVIQIGTAVIVERATTHSH
jgi:hypothetical protein